MSIRILLADDHKIVRQGLRSLLAQAPEMHVVGEASDGRTAVQLARELSPDVIIMDVSMPDLNGVEATQEILAEKPDVRVIALSMHSDRRFVTRMLKAGALGYMLKDCAFEELTRAVRSVAENKIYLSPDIADMVIRSLVRRHSGDELSNYEHLTKREREVLQLISEGKTTREIASRLNVSIKTIETHRQQIMDKLNIHSIAELTKFAIREGLTSLDS